MKKQIIIIATLVLSAYSCKKCATCTTTMTTTVSQPTTGYPKTESYSQELCGEDLKSADGNTTTATAKSGNITATTTGKTTCK
jgi:hypothetical protein